MRMLGPLAVYMRGLREGAGGGGGSAPLSLPFSRILLKIYKRNTEMNIEVPFSGPLFPELGS